MFLSKIDFQSSTSIEPVPWISRIEQFSHPLLLWRNNPLKHEMHVGSFSHYNMDINSEILQRYGDNALANPYKSLTNTNVWHDEYVDTSVSHIIQVRSLSNAHCLGSLLHGFDEDFWVCVHSKDVEDIFDIEHFPRKIECELQSVLEFRINPGSSQFSIMRAKYEIMVYFKGSLQYYNLMNQASIDGWNKLLLTIAVEVFPFDGYIPKKRKKTNQIKWLVD